MTHRLSWRRRLLGAFVVTAAETAGTLALTNLLVLLERRHTARADARAAELENLRRALAGDRIAAGAAAIARIDRGGRLGYADRINLATVVIEALEPGAGRG